MYDRYNDNVALTYQETITLIWHEIKVIFTKVKSGRQLLKF